MIFLHNLKYAFITILRNKANFIWTLLFPIGLATFMNAAFGNIYEKDEMFQTIPIAVVKEEANVGLHMMLQFLSGDGEDSLFAIKTKDAEEARGLLEKKEIKGIVYVSKEPRLLVESESIEATILKKVIEEFDKNETVFRDIAKRDNVAAIKTIADKLSVQQKNYYTEMSSTNGVQNEFYCYFYAIFAMSCLFASFAGVDKIGRLQANESALGMRRNLSGTSKASVVVSEFIAASVMQFVIELIVLGYMTLLGIDFGSRYPAIILTLFLGASIGISMGMIIASFSKLSMGLREGICVMVSMVLSVLADLCVGGIKHTIEQTIPILNRINPAALIADSLYALNVYDNYDRYLRNTIILGGMAVGMLVISFMILRRNKYASL